VADWSEPTDGAKTLLTHRSPLLTHRSPLLTHRSPLLTHRSDITADVNTQSVQVGLIEYPTTPLEDGLSRLVGELH
jgi:hypothetical protein